jgi:hypothetical protein
MMIGTPQERHDLKARWSTFCESHLIGWDMNDQQTRETQEQKEKEKIDNESE